MDGQQKMEDIVNGFSKQWSEVNFEFDGDGKFTVRRRLPSAFIPFSRLNDVRDQLVGFKSWNLFCTGQCDISIIRKEPLCTRTVHISLCLIHQSRSTHRGHFCASSLTRVCIELNLTIVVTHAVLLHDAPALYAWPSCTNQAAVLGGIRRLDPCPRTDCNAEPNLSVSTYV